MTRKQGQDEDTKPWKGMQAVKVFVEELRDEFSTQSDSHGMIRTYRVSEEEDDLGRKVYYQ